MTADDPKSGPLRRWLIAGLAGVVLVNALLLLWVIPRQQEELSSHYGVDFADDYDDLALSLVQGRGYRFAPDIAPTMMREPGYPIFLAAIFSVFGRDLGPVRVANLVLMWVSAGLLMVLARRLTGSPTVALLAPALFLVHPGVVVAESRGGVEALFIPLLLAFMILVDAALRSGRVWLYALAGVVLGVTVLTRSTPILFPCFLAAYALLPVGLAGSRSGRVARIALMAAVAAAVMTPWIVRNYRLVGHIVPTATVQGVASQAGQYVCTHLTFDEKFVELDTAAGAKRQEIATAAGYRFRGGYYQYFFASDEEYAFNQDLLGRVLRTYLEHPLLLARCAAANLLFHFWFTGRTWSVTAINVLVQLPYLVLAGMGLVTLHRKRQLARCAPIALLVVYIASVHAPILAQARYSVPAVPFLSILAASALAPLLSRLGAKGPA